MRLSGSAKNGHASLGNVLCRHTCLFACSVVCLLQSALIMYLNGLMIVS